MALSEVGTKMRGAGICRHSKWINITPEYLNKSYSDTTIAFAKI